MMVKRFLVRPISFLLLAYAVWDVPRAEAGELAEDFQQPPPECRPQVLWDWMGGMISREGITKDLEALKAQGVGGVMIMQMPDQPPYPRQWSFHDYPGKVKILGDDYFATINFAIGEADRLGLEFGIFACPGWSHFGGPWIKPEEGLKKFSGTVPYRTEFDSTAGAHSSAAQFHDFGGVENLVRVTLNGHDLGVVWCAPWRVAIPVGLLREKSNMIEVAVTNTWIGRMIGEEQEPEDCELEWGNADGDRMGGYAPGVRGRGLKDLPDWFVKGQPRPSAGRFTFSSWQYYDHAAPLQPSGLFGPVRLLSTAANQDAK